MGVLKVWSTSGGGRQQPPTPAPVTALDSGYLSLNWKQSHLPTQAPRSLQS